MSEIRSRCYHLILYKEDLEHLRVIDSIEQHYNSAAIKHDKDIDELTNKVKKEHYHVILYFDNPKYLSSLCKELQLKANYIRTDELKRGLEYLIHKNHPDKYQYSIDEVYGPLKENLLNYLSKSIENEKTSTLLLYSIIDTYDGPISYSELIPIVIYESNSKDYFVEQLE